MELGERYLHAINELLLADKGSLWNISDIVWQSVIYDFKIKRKGHPGLVFAHKPFNSLKDTVPVMIGSSREVKFNPGFKIRGVMPPKPYTYFTMLRPCNVRPGGTASDALAIENFTGSSQYISRNDYKSRLDDDEMKELDAYLRNKGINL